MRVEPLGPRLGEAVPGLGAVADDRQAARRAATQQHLPLGVGELLRLVDHDVREGSRQQVGVRRRQRAVVDQRGLQVVVDQHRHEAVAEPVGARLARRRAEVVDHLGHPRPFACLRCLRTTSAPRLLRVAEPQARGVEQRQVGVRPRLGVRPAQRLHLVGLEPGRAAAQVGRDRPEVADEVGVLDERPRAVEGVAQAAVPVEHPPEVVAGQLVGVELVGEDRQDLVPHVVAREVVGRAGVGGVEGLGPLGRR